MVKTSTLITIKKRLHASVPEYKSSIAALTGVKYPTIFRVLNGEDKVADSTREMVLDAAVLVLQRELNDFRKDLVSITK